MDFDDFEWSQGAPTHATMSETMCGMFLFRKKKIVFLWKNIFLHFGLLYSYAEGELHHENRTLGALKIIKIHDFQ